MWFESVSYGWTILENSRFVIVFADERYSYEDPDPSHSTLKRATVLS